MYEESFSKLPSVDTNHQLHLDRYIKFINSRPIRVYKSKSGLCRHHIQPVSLGSEKGFSKEKWNIIVLTLREHYIAHLLLWKTYGNEMAKAFIIMTKQNNTNLKLTSRQYNTLKKDSSKFSSIKTGKKVICLEDNQVFDSVSLAGEYYQICTSQISNCCNLKKLSTHNLHFIYYDTFIILEKEELLKRFNKNKKKEYRKQISKKVICLETKEVFNSITETASKMKISYNNIRCCCYHLKHSNSGYHFVFYNEYIKSDFIFIEEKEIKQTIKIICLEDNIIYESIMDASRKYGVLAGNISKSCQSKGKMFVKGYHFMYYEEYILYGYNKNELNVGTLGKKRKVVRIEDKVVFNSIKEAEKECGFFGISKSCISNGNQQVGNFHFMYYEKYLLLNT